MNILAIIFAATGLVLLILCGIFFIECLLGRHRASAAHIDITPDLPNAKFVILMPAHNESKIIGDTLSDLAKHVSNLNQVIVIADNCSDDTANIARELGAKVVERNEPEKRGKGYALAFGMLQAEACEEDIVIVLDADCKVDQYALNIIASKASALDRPIQASYEMGSLETSNIGVRISLYAWRVKNFLRPMGLKQLGLPCQLMGTGMAFPKRLLNEVSLASSNIVEDIQLGLDLAQLGHPPFFEPDARVWSDMPHTKKAANTQRTRWEHGHLLTIFGAVPKAIYKSVLERNTALATLAVDLSIPPLSFLAMLLVVQCLVSLLMIFLNIFAPAFISVIALSVFAGAIAISWDSIGRNYLKTSDSIHLIKYAMSKFSIYKRFFQRHKSREWVRTER